MMIHLERKTFTKYAIDCYLQFPSRNPIMFNEIKTSRDIGEHVKQICRIGEEMLSWFSFPKEKGPASICCLINSGTIATSTESPKHVRAPLVPIKQIAQRQGDSFHTFPHHLYAPGKL